MVDGDFSCSVSTRQRDTPNLRAKKQRLRYLRFELRHSGLATSCMDPLSALADIATGTGAGGRPMVDAYMSDLLEELNPARRLNPALVIDHGLRRQYRGV